MEKNSQRPRPSYIPVQTRRAFEEVAEQIRDQLSNGLLKPGDRLPPERELAEQFNLSRNTVREALRALEMSGLLEFRKGATGGAFVREGQSDAVVAGFSDLFRLGVIRPADLIEARMIVGVEVTRLACARASDQDFAELEANLDASEAAERDNAADQRLKINLDFHVILARAANNPVLLILIDALTGIHLKLLQTMTPAANAKVIASRRKLLGYLRARNEEKAVTEMKRHLAALGHHYMTQYEEREKSA
ncbi:FadR/GntR family transcriptional regulator [Pseudomonas mangiferae]|uniref:FadR/GntR family transcriptional regulator n=1 Tax=Pseudomonas mangiferae TaxID=2593654 RepID=UPI0015B6E641|nr:FadR/GntR family transcriptional regulator [Pseudomonas mangiferae]